MYSHHTCLKVPNSQRFVYHNDIIGTIQQSPICWLSKTSVDGIETLLLQQGKYCQLQIGGNGLLEVMGQFIIYFNFPSEIGIHVQFILSNLVSIALKCILNRITSNELYIIFVGFYTQIIRKTTSSTTLYQMLVKLTSATKNSVIIKWA